MCIVGEREKKNTNASGNQIEITIYSNGKWPAAVGGQWSIYGVSRSIFSPPPDGGWPLKISYINPRAPNRSSNSLGEITAVVPSVFRVTFSSLYLVIKT